jgi:hypothetical protein
MTGGLSSSIRTGRWFCGAILLALLALGCGGKKSELPKTYQVTGTVSGDSVAGGAVQLTPLAENASFSVSGDINADGTFSLSTIMDSQRKSGVPEGEYRVTIIKPIPKDQRTAPPVVLPEPFRVEAKDNALPIDLAKIPKQP